MITHDDYCKVIGQVVLDSYQNAMGLRAQIELLSQSKNSEIEKLKEALKEANAKLGNREANIQGV